MNDLEIFGRMCALAAFSPTHQRWSLTDAARLFMPSISLKQFVMLEDGSGFATWGWLSKEASSGFVTRTRKLQSSDWQSGSECWVIDLIAPFGNVIRVIRAIRNALPKKQKVFGPRSYENNTVRRVGEWVNA